MSAGASSPEGPGGGVNHDKSGRQGVSKRRPSCERSREGHPYRRRVGPGTAGGPAGPEQPPRGRSSSVTSQVSSPAEQADEADARQTRRGTAQARPATKDVRRLDRVIIRFAGDSGDGMQLTGDRFTSETASFGNDLSTLPNFPAEIRAPAGTLPGRLRLPAALRRPRHPHPGRRAERAGRDEPGRAEGEHRRRAARRGDHRQHGRVHQAGDGRRSATTTSPAGGRLAGRLPASTRCR